MIPTPDKLFLKSYVQTAFPAGELPERIVEEARKWVGVPFRHAGRDRLGIDCVGLPIKILHFLGFTDWDDTDYSRSVNPARMKGEIELFCERIEGGSEQAKKADLLWFNVCGAAQHVGIYTGEKDNTIIHAYESAGKVVEHIFNDKWKRRVESVYRFVGIE